MKRTEYQAYLASREWAVLKRQVAERSGGFCERHAEGCQPSGPVAATSVHHATYERLGHELLGDLVHVCEPCHEFLSGAECEDPTAHDWRYFVWAKPRSAPGERRRPESGLKLCATCGLLMPHGDAPSWLRDLLMVHSETAVLMIPRGVLSSHRIELVGEKLASELAGIDVQIREVDL